MNLEDIDKILIGEKNFRKSQIMKFIFQNKIENFNEATNLPLELRKKLEKNISLKIEHKLFFNNDKSSVKAIIKLKDGGEIESVLLRHKDRNTVCLSSQLGCAMKCEFCATGKMGFTRNLSVYEILEQVLLFSRLLHKENQRVNSIVFMGMGEPLLNYKAVIEAVKLINNKDFFNIGIRHISISTCGISEKIKELAEEKMEINLALSLHFVDDKSREKFMPINKSNPINEVFSALKYFIKKTKRKVMIEYIMLKDINDSVEDAKSLARLLIENEESENIKGQNLAPHYFVNLIAYNETGDFKASSKENIKKFKDELTKEKISVVERYRYAKDIIGACGQLALKIPKIYE